MIKNNMRSSYSDEIHREEYLEPLRMMANVLHSGNGKFKREGCRVVVWQHRKGF